MVFKVDSLSLSLPFGLGGVTITRSEAQRRAAWALYVELATRISTQKLEPGSGSAREALNSLYSLFDTVRQTLSTEGPNAVAGPDSVGPLSIRLLNEGLRPFMVTWHTKLSTFEDAERERLAEAFGPQFRGNPDESRWEHRDAFYTDLEALRVDLREFCRALGLICGAELPTESELDTPILS